MTGPPDATNDWNSPDARAAVGMRRSRDDEVARVSAEDKIGVGNRIAFGSPSLRTGRADLPYPLGEIRADLLSFACLQLLQRSPNLPRIATSV
jgi:hypothetical protein